ncbi:MAG: hypothetical protein IPO37_03540 [Saprospiraceae bacterium]|nr:hypothetical protein [Saprospiraceae bacterium]
MNRICILQTLTISLALAFSTYLAISLVTDGDVSTLILLWQDTDSNVSIYIKTINPAIIYLLKNPS